MKTSLRNNLAFNVVCIFLLSGCAVTHQPDSSIPSIQLDVAELFGTELGRVPLADGTEGVLRRDPQGNYSFKSKQHLKVIPIKNALTARIAAAGTIGSETTILIEASEKKCRYRYHLISVTGFKARLWYLGNCTDRPRASAGGGFQFFDFRDGRNLIRYETDGIQTTRYTMSPPEGYARLTQPFADESLKAPSEDSPAYSAISEPYYQTQRNGRIIPLLPVRVAESAFKTQPAASAKSSAKQSGKQTTSSATKSTGPIKQASLPLQEDVIQPVIFDWK